MGTTYEEGGQTLCFGCGHALYRGNESTMYCANYHCPLRRDDNAQRMARLFATAASELEMAKGRIAKALAITRRDGLESARRMSRDVFLDIEAALSDPSETKGTPT